MHTVVRPRLLLLDIFRLRTAMISKGRDSRATAVVGQNLAPSDKERTLGPRCSICTGDALLLPIDTGIWF